MPIASFTNTTNRVLAIKAEGGDYPLGPGSDIKANFSDEEWASAKAQRNEAREATKIRRRDLGVSEEDIAADEKMHIETVERDKAWVLWREQNNAKADSAARLQGRPS